MDSLLIEINNYFEKLRLRIKFDEKSSSIIMEIFPFLLAFISIYIKLMYLNSFINSVLRWPNQQILWNFNVYLANISAIILLFLPLIFIPKLWRILFLILIDSFITLIILADFYRLIFWGDIFSMFDLSSVGMITNIKQSIRNTFEYVHFTFFLDIFILFIFLIFYFKSNKYFREIPFKIKKKILTISLIIILIFSLPSIYIAFKNRDGAFSYTSLQREVASLVGLLPYHYIDIYLYFIRKEYEIDKNQIKRVKSFLIDNVQDNDESEFFGIAKGLNLIVVLAESLQQFPLDLDINGKPVTPNLNKFIEDSMYFVNFFDQTHLGTTSDAEFISFQSLHAVPIGTVAKNYYKNDFYGLANILAQHGYTTISASGARKSFWGMEKMHKNLGFNRSFFKDSFKVKEIIWECISDKKFFNKIVPKLVKQKEPLFAYLLSCSNHHPYKIPNNFIEFDAREFEGTLVGDYLKSVNYFDVAFGKFVARLKKYNLLESSLIVVLGDHHAFLDSDYNNLAKLLGLKDFSVYERFVTKKRIPMFIRFPNAKFSRTIDTIGGHIDVSPTILNLLGIKVHKRVMLGSDLTSVDDSFVVFRNGSFINNKYVYINSFPNNNSLCYRFINGNLIDCKFAKDIKNKSREQLEISDLIIRGDLIPVILKN